MINRRNAVVCCQCHQLFASLGEERIAGNHERAGVQFDEGGESGIDLVFGAGLEDKLHPLRARRVLHRLAYISRHLLDCSLRRTSKPIIPAWGTNSDTSSRRLGSRSAGEKAKPVRLPPGRGRLATKPNSTGSPTLVKTIGIVEVARFAATAGAVPATATITSTFWVTRSAANAGSRSGWPSAQRYSIATFFPST